MHSELDKEMIQRAIDLAKEAREKGNEPFGAVLVKDGHIMMEGNNQIHTQHDPTNHAELGLIREYCQKNKTSDLSDYTLYTSCEPCCMCSGAMVWSKLGRMCYSVSHESLAKIAGSNIMIGSKEVFSKSPHQPIVQGKILEKEGLTVFNGYEW